MGTSIRIRSVWPFCWLTVVACTKAPPPGAPRVVQVVPAAGEVASDGLRDGIRLTFDRPVAAPSELGRALQTSPIVIVPATPGEARWLDVQTLAYFPKQALLSSTRYQLTIPEPLTPGGPAVVWDGLAFVFDRISIAEDVGWEGPAEYQSTRPTARLRVSMPMNEKSVAAACGFFERRPDGSLGTHVEAEVVPEVATSSAPGTFLRLRPADPLRPGTPYTLRCGTKLLPKNGSEGLAKEWTTAFSTYGAAAVKQMGPEGRDIAADGVKVRVTFATPMAPETVRAHVHLRTLEADNSIALDLSGDGLQVVYSWAGDLVPGTSYVLVVDAGMKDKFGQVLTKESRHEFKVGDASPRLRMETGIYVAERAGGKYPIWTRNLEAFHVRCAAIPETRLAGVLTGPANYDAWWDASDRKPIDWAGLGLKRQDHQVKPAAARNQWHDDGVDLGTVCGDGAPAGIYLVDTRTTVEHNGEGKVAPRERRSLVNVTDLGLLAKVGNVSSLVWVVRLSDGKPVSGAAVQLRDLTGKVRFSGTTNADGVLQGPGAARLLGVKPHSDGEDAQAEFEDYRARRVLVTARAGDDLAVLDTNWNNGVQVWNFGVNEDRTGGKIRVRGFLQSDRGLYRPGDTVHLRGLVRFVDQAGHMTVPKKRRVHVAVEDPRGQVIREDDLPVSPYGGFWLDLPVADDSHLGDFWVKGTIEGQTFRERFSVEEYRPRTFELKLRTPKKDVILGTAMRFEIEAAYLYGSPLRGAKLSWTLRKREHRPRFAGHDEYVFQDFAAQGAQGRWWARDEERSFSDTVGDGEVEIPATGRTVIVARDDAKVEPSPQDYLFEVTVTDSTGQAVTQSTVVRGHRSNLYLGLHPSEFVQAVDMPFGVQVLGFDRSGVRRAALVELTLTKRSYDCGAHGENAWWSCQAKDAAKPAVTRQVAVPEAGSAAVERVKVAEPGEYVVRVRGPDGTGHEAVAADVIWVVGEGEAFWSGDEGDRMTVVASKANYAPGDVARLVPQAQLPGARALLTVERDGVLSYALHDLATTGTAINLSIEPRFAPNVFASLVLVRGRTGAGDKGRPRFKMGVVDLKVANEERRLAVTVEPDRSSYEPGDMVKARVRVTDAAGRPVRAEVALAAADEGVLQIAGYETPDPLPVFYAAYGMGMETATTWNRLLKVMDPTRADEDEEGGDGGGEDAGRVRSRFLATAYFNPALVTRADGTAEVAFFAPDNLTAFRLMAVAADAGDRFGRGDKRFTVKKSLQVQPALPRFLTVGDTLRAAALLQNNTPVAIEALVTMKATGLLIDDGAPRAVRVPSLGSVRVEFGMRATAAGTATVTFDARAGALRDVVEIKIPVTRPSVAETVSLGEGSTSARVSLDVPATLAPVGTEGDIEVVVDATGLSRLDESTRYLVGYPYGCLEQTTSKIVPMIALTELAGAVGLTAGDADRAKKFVQTGLAKIVRHQHADGGFGLWIGAPPEVHYTAYALWGLGIAKAAGYPVDDRAVSEGVAYLKREVASKARPGAHAAEVQGELGARAFAFAALAEVGQGDAAAVAALFEHRSELPVYGRAFLARALQGAQRPDLLATLIQELGAAVPGAGVALMREGEHDLGWYWSSNVRTTALVLQALVQNAPSHPAIPRLVEALLGAREAGRWGSTQENVHAMLALAAVGKARLLSGPRSVSVQFGPETIGSQSITGPGVARFVLPVGSKTRSGGSITLTATGGEIFYAVRARLRRPLSPVAVDRGLTVDRVYLDADTNQPVTTVKLGQTLRVRMTVQSPRKLSHVAVVDPLPAGLEPVITRFAKTGSDQPENSGHGGIWWWSWETQWTHQELRDDRVELFADVLAAGPSTRDYLVRATSVGHFVLGPVTAHAMYQPQTTGRSAASTLVVEK